MVRDYALLLKNTLTPPQSCQWERRRDGEYQAPSPPSCVPSCSTSSLVYVQAIGYSNFVLWELHAGAVVTTRHMQHADRHFRPPTEYIPPVQEPYDFIIFRASEVKDLSVDEPAQRPRTVHDDPAVVGVSRRVPFPPPDETIRMLYTVRERKNPMWNSVAFLLTSLSARMHAFSD